MSTGTANFPNDRDEVPIEPTPEPVETKSKRGRPRKENFAIVPMGDPEVTAKIGLLELALRSSASIEVIERMVALQERAQARAAETEFNDALNRVQKDIDVVRPDLRNPSTNSKYASYAALDQEVRPFYTKEGFSLNFSEDACPKPDHIRRIGVLRRGAHKEVYYRDVAIDTKGIRGNQMMTLTHAEGSAHTYGKRYLLGDIFNIPVGDIEPDDDGNAAGALQAQAPPPNSQPSSEHARFLKQAIGSINEAVSLDDLKGRWQTVRKMALSMNDAALVEAMDKAKEGRKEALLAARKGN